MASTAGLGWGGVVVNLYGTTEGKDKTQDKNKDKNDKIDQNVTKKITNTLVSYGVGHCLAGGRYDCCRVLQAAKTPCSPLTSAVMWSVPISPFGPCCSVAPTGTTTAAAPAWVWTNTSEGLVVGTLRQEEEQGRRAKRQKQETKKGTAPGLSSHVVQTKTKKEQHQGFPRGPPP